MGITQTTRRLVRQRNGPGLDQDGVKKRMATSRYATQEVVNNPHPSDQLGPAIGRQGNDWPTPDSHGIALVETVNGQRLQDFANTHLGEGEAPGRIPRFWNNRDSAKTGRSSTGNRSGDQGIALNVTGEESGGIGDAKYVQQLPIPRGTVVARAFARAVDDSANIPAVFVSDPTRR